MERYPRCSSTAVCYQTRRKIHDILLTWVLERSSEQSPPGQTNEMGDSKSVVELLIASIPSAYFKMAVDMKTGERLAAENTLGCHELLE